MAGTFELFADEDSRIRFRLVAADGSVLAVSGQYPDKYQAAAAIKDVRECAGTGLIQDLSLLPVSPLLRRSGWAPSSGRLYRKGRFPRCSLEGRERQQHRDG